MPMKSPFTEQWKADGIFKYNRIKRSVSEITEALRFFMP